MESPDLNPTEFIHKWEPQINQLNPAELRLLNRMVVDRINLIHKAGNLMNMAKFNVGEVASFRGSDGIERRGKILRINSKTISIQTEMHGYWKVSPSLLRKVRE